MNFKRALNLLYSRREQPEDGFTLIELMVVVVIIGILVTIAVPTFLSARVSAQDKAAESLLRNAFTTAKVVYVKHDGKFSTSYSVLQSDLTSAEPSLTFSSSFISNVADVAPLTASAVCFSTPSASGKVAGIMDVESSTIVGVNAGTYYYLGVANNNVCPSSLTSTSLSPWFTSAALAGW